MSAIRAAFVAMLMLSCAGCNPETFRAETKLLSDGGVERIVYQPLNRVPEGGRKAPEWESTHRVQKTSSDANRRLPFDEIIARFGRSAGKENPNDYWIGKGKFTEVKTIPDYLVFKAPEGLKDGRLVRQLERKDWGVVTEWVWQETLTDCVTLTDHRKARSEVIETAIPIIVEACGKTWGPRYDLKEFEQWLRGDVATCFEELCDVVLEVGLDKHKQSWDGPAQNAKFDAILQKYGLHFFDADHKPLNGKLADQRWDEFSSKMLRQYVRDQDGKPLADDKIQDAISGRDDSRLVRALGRIAYAKYGGEKKFEEYCDRMGTRLFGLYIWPILFRDIHSFDYRMEVSGFVLETNATQIAERKLQWTFLSDNAFPLGYAMRATVAIPNVAALEKHFPNAKLDSHESVVNYLDLVRADAKLKRALDKLVQENDPTLWNEWLDFHRDPKIRELLKLNSETKQQETP